MESPWGLGGCGIRDALGIRVHSLTLPPFPQGDKGAKGERGERGDRGLRGDPVTIAEAFSSFSLLAASPGGPLQAAEGTRSLPAP